MNFSKLNLHLDNSKMTEVVSLLHALEGTLAIKFQPSASCYDLILKRFKMAIYKQSYTPLSKPMVKVLVTASVLSTSMTLSSQIRTI